MNMNKKPCPCPTLDCPNHGDCAKCTSRHVRVGWLNYCSFHTLLPTLKEVIKTDPESPAIHKLDALIKRQLYSYEKRMDKHGLSEEKQKKILKESIKFSDH